MNAKTLITPHNFELSEAARAQIEEAVQPLFTQELYVSRVEVAIESERANNQRIVYSTTVRAQLRAQVLFEIVRGEKILPAVESATLALRQRLLRTPALV